MQEQRISLQAALFSRFAGADLDRWREAIGCTVVHRDPRWGEGQVEDVLWGPRHEGPLPDGVIMLKIAYRNGLSTRLRAAVFASIHTSVCVPSPLGRLLIRCYEGSQQGKPECAAQLAALDEEIRRRRDAERLERAADLRRRAARRRETQDR